MGRLHRWLRYSQPRPSVTHWPMHVAVFDLVTDEEMQEAEAACWNSSGKLERLRAQKAFIDDCNKTDKNEHSFARKCYEVWPRYPVLPMLLSPRTSPGRAAGVSGGFQQPVRLSCPQLSHAQPDAPHARQPRATSLQHLGGLLRDCSSMFSP